MTSLIMPIAATAPSLVRGIDRQPGNLPRQDHEGDLESLPTECVLDRKETGCAGHDYFEYDTGHFPVWRARPNAELQISSLGIGEGGPTPWSHPRHSASIRGSFTASGQS